MKSSAPRTLISTATTTTSTTTTTTVATVTILLLATIVALLPITQTSGQNVRQQAAIKSTGSDNTQLGAAPFYQIRDGKTSSRRIQQNKTRQQSSEQSKAPNSFIAPSNGLRFNGSESTISDGQGASGESTANGNFQSGQQSIGQMMIDSFSKLVATEQSFIDDSNPSTATPQFDSIITTSAVPSPAASSAPSNGEQSTGTGSMSTTATSVELTESSLANDERQAATKSLSPSQLANSNSNSIDQLMPTKSNQSPNPNSLSMSLDGMIVNSRPRGKSSKTQSRSPTSRSGELASIGQQRAQQQNFNNILGGGTGQSQQGTGRPSRRVPVKGLGYSMPSSLGQRTKPTASNQFVGGRAMSEIPLKSMQSNDESVDISQMLTPSMSNSPFNTMEDVKNDDPSEQRQLYSDSMSFQEFGKFSTGQPITNENRQNGGSVMITPSSFGQSFTTTPQNSDISSNDQIIMGADPIVHNDMVMSVISSTDGKDRRLVMMARDTYKTLQHLASVAAAQGNNGVAISTTVASNMVNNRAGGGTKTSDSNPFNGVVNNWWPLPANSDSWTGISNKSLSSSQQQDEISQTSFSSLSASPTTTTTFAPRDIVTSTTPAPIVTVAITTTTTTTQAPPTSGSSIFGLGTEIPTKFPSANNNFREVASGELLDRSRQVDSTQAASSQAQLRPQNQPTELKTTKSQVNKQNGTKSQQVSSTNKRVNSNSNGSNSKLVGTKGGKKKNSNRPNTTTPLPSPSPPPTTTTTTPALVAQTNTKVTTVAPNKLPQSSGNRVQNGKSKKTTGQRSQQQNGENRKIQQANKATKTNNQQQQQLSPTSSPAIVASSIANSGGNLPVSSTGGQNKRQQQVVVSNNTISTTTPTDNQPIINSSSPSALDLDTQTTKSPISRLTSEQQQQLDKTSDEQNVSGNANFGREMDKVQNVASNYGYTSLDKQLDDLERNMNSLDDGSGNGDEFEQQSRTSGPMNQIDGLRATIPGEPLRDYPIYATPPNTSFDCMTQTCPGGYYADMESNCQAFHICQSDGHFDTFLCPNGTIFSQQHFVCVWWWQFDCQQSASFYALNDRIYCNTMSTSNSNSAEGDALLTEASTPGTSCDKPSTVANLSNSTSENPPPISNRQETIENLDTNNISSLKEKMDKSHEINTKTITKQNVTT